MRRYFLLILLLIGVPFTSFAGIHFSTLLPNPIGKDEDGEYIEIRNTGCESRDISGYVLLDASGKTYVIPSGTEIPSHENFRYPYSTTKIALNNSGFETVTLKDSLGNVVDQVEYSGTQKDDVVIYFSLADEDCSVPNPVIPDDSASGTGQMIETGSGDVSGTGSTSGSGSESIGSGGSEQNPPNPLSQGGSGSIGTGSEQTPLNPILEGGSGTTETGSISQGSGGIESGTGGSEQNPPHSPDTNSGQTLVQEGSGSTGTGSEQTVSQEGSGSSEPTLLGGSGSGQVILNPSLEGGYGTIETGATSTLTGDIYVETGVLAPIEMYYSDSDKNGRIDTLEIKYPYILTGTVHTGTIALYSATGGLYSHQINSLTGYIAHATLSGNILILQLVEGDREKTTLKVNNTTSSELRLKSTGNLGFHSIGGQVPVAFFLTTSFENYKKVYAGDIRYKIGDMSFGTGETEIPSQGIITSTGTNIEAGNSIISPSEEGSGTTEAGVLFPEIIPTFQNYTNTTNSGDILTCTTMPCRVNFTLEPIFTGGYLQKDFTCHITFGTGSYDTCNPPQLYPTGSGNIVITLTHQASSERITKIIEVQMALVVTTVGGNITNLIMLPDNHPPIAVIDMDGKWKKYFTSPEVNLLRCYAFTCSVNFTGENSSDPDGDELRFLWLYDFAEVSTKKDPGVRTFTIGTYSVYLRAIDPYGAVGEARYTIEVMHPDLMPRDEAEKVEKVTKVKKSKSSKIEAKKSTKKTKMKKKKPKPIVFYDPPALSIQNQHPENIKITNNIYTCFTKTKKCSINFTLTGAQSGYSYEWSFPGQSGSYVSKNPRSFSFALGESQVQLIVKDLAGNILTSQDIGVKVIKTTKTRSTAKKVVKPKKQKTENPPKENPNNIANIPTTIPKIRQEEGSLLFLIFLAGSGVSGYLAMRRRGGILPLR